MLCSLLVGTLLPNDGSYRFVSQRSTSAMVAFASYFRKGIPMAMSQNKLSWRGRAEQILLDQVGCEARKTPVGGDVFFLDFSESGSQMTVSGTICAFPERQ